MYATTPSYIHSSTYGGRRRKKNTSSDYKQVQTDDERKKQTRFQSNIEDEEDSTTHPTVVYNIIINFRPVARLFSYCVTPSYQTRTYTRLSHPIPINRNVIQFRISLHTDTDGESKHENKTCFHFLSIKRKNQFLLGVSRLVLFSSFTTNYQWKTMTGTKKKKPIFDQIKLCHELRTLKLSFL